MKPLTANYRLGFSLAILLCLFFLVQAIFQRTGVPREFAVYLTGLAAIVLCFLPSLRGGTTRFGNFDLADRNASAWVNALAISGVVAFPILMADSGVLVFANMSLVIVLLAATLGGLAASTLLVGRRQGVDKSGDIATVLLRQYQSTPLAQMVSVVVAIAGLGLLSVALATADTIIGWYFNLSIHAAAWITIAFVLMVVAFGGLASITRLSAVSTLVMLAVINVSLLWLVFQGSGYYLGQFQFGYGALERIWDLEEQLRGLAIAPISSALKEVSSAASWTSGQQFLIGILVSLGVFALPQLAHQFGANERPERAGVAGSRAILLLAFMGLTTIAFLAYAKLGLYETILGLAAGDVGLNAPFLTQWGDKTIDLISVCGAVLNSTAAAVAACKADPNYVLSVSDFVIDARLLFVAAAEFNNMPFAITSLLVLSAILMLISFASAALFSISSNLTSAFYAILPKRVSSGRIFMIRLLSIIIAVWMPIMLANVTIDPVEVFVASMGLLASCVFLPMLAAYGSSQISAFLMSFNVLLGFLVTAVFSILMAYGVDLLPDTGDELKLTFLFSDTPIIWPLAGLFGLLASILFLAFSLAHAWWKRHDSKLADSAPLEN